MPLPEVMLRAVKIRRKERTSPEPEAFFSQPAQVLHNLRLAPIHRPNKLSPDGPPAVNDVSLRKFKRPVARGHRRSHSLIILMARVADGEQINRSEEHTSELQSRSDL